LHCNENYAFTLAADPACFWNPAKMEVVVMIIKATPIDVSINQAASIDIETNRKFTFGLYFQKKKE